MIRCYVDGKLSDCDISDCNICKKGIEQMEEETKADLLKKKIRRFARL